MSGIQTVLRSFLLIFSLFFLLNTTTSANSCKGLSKNKCSSSSSCSWVKGYETQKGTKVDSYCRNKSGKSDTSKPQSKQSDKSKKSTTSNKSKQSDKSKKSTTSNKSKQTDKSKKSTTSNKSKQSD